MNDSEFIELLNLYLDHEIDPADAERLEAEVHRDARRREIYRQYCQMQAACAQLAGQFADASETERSVEVFTPTRISRPTWYAGGLAAAACLTLVLLVKSHKSAAPSDTAPQVAVAPVAVAPAKTDSFTTVPVNFNLNAAQAVASSDTPAQLNWLRTVQYSPVNLNTSAPDFSVKPADHPSVLVAPQISQQPLEHVAFTPPR